MSDKIEGTVSIGECESCHFEDIEVTTYRAPPFRENQEPRDLCKVCASSYIGNATGYPNQYENVALFQSLGYCTNLILQAIAKSHET